MNFPLFSQPSDLAFDPLPKAAGPVLGWAGTIRPELDLGPLLYTARTMPRWTFVLLGPQGEGNPLLPRLRRLPNVILPGGCPMAQVPDWLYRCNILMDFLRDDRTCDDLVSCRMLEYLPPAARGVYAVARPDRAPARRGIRGPLRSSSSPSAATPWTSRPTSPPSAAAVTPLRPPGPCAVPRW